VAVVRRRRRSGWPGPSGPARWSGRNPCSSCLTRCCAPINTVSVRVLTQRYAASYRDWVGSSARSTP